MRVVHLSTYDHKGGAARSAWRLHAGLLELGCKSTMLVREKSSGHPTVRALPWERNARQRFWEGLAREYVWCNRTTVSTSHFSLGQPGLDLSPEPEVAEADVIHLHWVSEFLSPASIASLAALRKPLVWTLHDERPFTGGCHFSGACQGFEQTCDDCPQLHRDPRQMTRRILEDESAATSRVPMPVVAPSQWLAGLARRSRRFAQKSVTVIPYGVSEREFFPEEKSVARRRLGLPDDAFLILSGSDHSGEKRKGLDLLFEAFEQLPLTTQAGAPIRLLAFGRSHPSLEPLGDRVISLGYLSDPESLRSAYAAADLFVLPSLEDNLPNTMLEALACGTAVVAFNVGGVPDVVRDAENGWLVAPGDRTALAAKLQTLVETAEACHACGTRGAALIAGQYTTRHQAERYLALYEGAVSSGVPHVAPRSTNRLARVTPLLALDMVFRQGVRGTWRQLREGFQPAA